MCVEGREVEFGRGGERVEVQDVFEGRVIQVVLIVAVIVIVRA